MSTFIKDKQKICGVMMYKNIKRNHVDWEITHCFENIEKGNTLAMHIDITGNDNQLEQALYLLHKFGIKYLDITFTGDSSYKNMLNLLNSYRYFEYIDISFNSDYNYVDGRKRDYKRLYEVLKSQTNLHNICVRLNKLFPIKMLKELSKLDDCLYTIYLQSSWRGRRDLDRMDFDDEEVYEFIKDSKIKYLHVTNQFRASYVLRGLLENTHIDYLHLDLGWLTNHGITTETIDSIYQLVDEVIQNNKTLKWINIASPRYPSDSRNPGGKIKHKYQDFKSDSGLKIFVNSERIN